MKDLEYCRTIINQALDGDLNDSALVQAASTIILLNAVYELGQQMVNVNINLQALMQRLERPVITVKPNTGEAGN